MMIFRIPTVVPGRFTPRQAFNVISGSPASSYARTPRFPSALLRKNTHETFVSRMFFWHFSGGTVGGRTVFSRLWRIPEQNNNVRLNISLIKRNIELLGPHAQYVQHLCEQFEEMKEPIRKPMTGLLTGEQRRSDQNSPE